MYGLANMTNLNFLRSIRLIQVCIGKNEIILNFDDNTSITIMSSITFCIDGGEGIVTNSFSDAAQHLINFIDHTIQAVQLEGSGVFKLRFSNNSSFQLSDDSQHYESYIIKKSNGETIVV